MSKGKRFKNLFFKRLDRPKELSIPPWGLPKFVKEELGCCHICYVLKNYWIGRIKNWKGN